MVDEADPRPVLTIALLREQAARFAERESRHHEPGLHLTDNGKTIGTYLEHKFQDHLDRQFRYERGNSARGIDFPGLRVDMKVTSVAQPQSSSPFDSARQKVYGLGYDLLVFVYEKHNDAGRGAARLEILHLIYVEAALTGDHQTTHGLLALLGREEGATSDEIVAYLRERDLPLGEAEARQLAQEILERPPRQGQITISNALQWRLNYNRAITAAADDEVEGVERLG
ncbi:MAG: restriction endonuclease [Planctomycetes bacterium]|nr:restriction endonuclease [Planctomycetota bacterium]